MFNESYTVMIKRPVEEVFAYVNDLDNTTVWQGGIEKVSYTQNPADLGTRFTLTRSFLGRQVKLTLKITEFEANQGYTARALDGPLNMDIRVSMEAVEGGTEMTTQVKGEAKGLARMGEGMIAAQMGLSLREDGERLKEILESR
jgi:carbon monoxide dehydrogenase subunit G